MAVYRTAQGKKLDMAVLAAKNEKVQAVALKGDGSKTTTTKLNARGDTIDSKGNVIKSMNEKRAESYAQTVGNKTAHIQRRPAPQPKQTENFDLTSEEKALNEMMADDHEVEQIKAQESKK